MQSEKVIEIEEEPACSTSSQPSTPRKLLRDAIVNTIKLPLSEINKKALENSNRKRKRIQAIQGEVLTNDDSIERMQLEAESRKTKQLANVTKKLKHKIDFERDTSHESEGEDTSDDDDAQCKFCSRWWSVYKGKRGDSLDNAIYAMSI